MTELTSTTAFPLSYERMPIPPTNSKAITGSDTDEFPQPTMLTVSGAGTIVYTPWGVETRGTDVTFTVTAEMVAAGWTSPFCVFAVKAASTATGILALYF